MPLGKRNLPKRKNREQVISERLSMMTAALLALVALAKLLGEVMSLIPLRNHRNGAMTRISEGLTRWTTDDRVGFGLSEYLDQIVDGLPVGVDE